MDNILLELERIDHIAEIEAATKPKLDNPIELPAKSEIEHNSVATKVMPENLTIEPSEVTEKSAETLYTPTEVMVENLVGKQSDMANTLSTPLEIKPENLAIEASDVSERSANMLSDLPSYLSQVYQNNRGAFITVGLFFGALIALKLSFAIGSAVNSIPLFAPFFQAIGLGYTGWFVYRYLLHASTREELGQEINALKSKVTGKSAA